MIKSIFNFKGINFWLLSSAIGLNFFGSLFLLLIVYLLVPKSQEYTILVQVGMMVISFAGPFLVGWLISKMAGDRKGLSYGVIGSFGAIATFLIFVLPAGIFGLILSLTSLLGGFNGALFYFKQLNSEK